MAVDNIDILYAERGEIMNEEEKKEIEQAFFKMQELHVASTNRDNQILELIDKLAKKIVRLEDIVRQIY